MNYVIVLELCRNSDFVRRIQNWYELSNDIEGYSLGEIQWNKIANWYLSESISVWNWDKFKFESHRISMKEIQYAKDLVVHYNLDINFELSNKYNKDCSTRYWSIVRDDKTINRLLGFVRNPKESRPTANAIYERNIQAEIEHADYVRACGSPYDCMHNENGERDSGEIWAKIS